MGLFSKVGSFIKENAHTILDVAGMIPGIGAVADLANAGLYAAEGDWVNAGLSAVSAIPGVGDTIALANKGMKVVKDAKTILKGGKGVKTLLKAGGKSIAKSVKGKMKVGGKLLKKLNPKKLYKSIKDKMKEVCLFGKCFTGDMLVYTEKGYVPIKEIKVGDRVYSRNEKTGETGYKKVEQISQTEAHTIYSIEVNDSTVIKTTAYHPFYVEEKGWISGINLKIGDQLVTPDGLASITKVSKERFEDPVIMYNFHVEDWVSYFVSVLSLYVHNGNCPKGNGKGNNYITFNKTHKNSQPRPKGKGPNGGGLQSHHGLQQQWAKENLSKYGYDPDLAPTVTIETGKGMPHTSISNAQNARRDARVADGKGKWRSSLQDELQNTADDFKQAGFSKETINQVMEQQYKMLDKINVKYERIDIK